MREMKQTATFNAKHRTYSGVLGVGIVCGCLIGVPPSVTA
jgi:hypothetical protein